MSHRDSGWDDHDPETGCAMLGLVIAGASLVLWFAVWWFFGLIAVLRLGLICAMLVVIIVWLAGNRR